MLLSFNIDKSPVISLLHYIFIHTCTFVTVTRATWLML